jgi:hypothetical protein
VNRVGFSKLLSNQIVVLFFVYVQLSFPSQFTNSVKHPKLLTLVFINVRDNESYIHGVKAL